MNKLALVIRKEYLERVKTRSFVLGTILGPVLIALLMFGPALLAKNTEAETQSVAIIDLGSEGVYSRIEAQVESARSAADGSFPLRVERYDLRGADALDAARAELDVRVQEDELSGYVVLPSDFLDSGKATYFGERLSGVVGVEVLDSMLDAAVQQHRMQQLGIAAADLAAVMQGADLELRSIGAADEADSLEARMLMGIAMIMLLYFMMIFYGQFTMMAVIEDKSSRVVEVMLASITPTQLMMGKIVGQGLVGLTQFGVWVLAGTLFSNFGGQVAGIQVDLGGISADLWVYFGIFFVLGYLLYSSLYAGVGALCASTQEAQQFQGPITMLIVLPMLLLQVALVNPDSGLSMGLSLFPLFTPMLMFIRVVVGKPEMWEIALGIALLAVTVFMLLRLTGKLFRLSILHFGKAPSWAQIVRILRTPE